MNSILRRRRAMMGVGSGGEIVIDGGNLIWQVGLLRAATGLLDPSYTTYISTDDYIQVKSTDAIISYTGPSADSNQVEYIVKIAEYSENYTFLGISNIYSNESIPLRFKNTCKFIKFSFGHGGSTGVNMNVQDGSLFTASIVPVSGRLPSTFQEVGWVGTNGNQSRDNSKIETNYAPTTNPKAEFGWLAPDTGSRTVFAINTSNTVYPAYELYTSSGNVYYKWGDSTINTGFTGYSTATWYSIVADISLTVNGTVKATKTATNWSGNTKTVKLFYGSASNVNSRLKEFKLYDGDTIVRDLVPCYRLSDNRIGFYDIVGNNFYTNAGAADVLTCGGAVI